MPILELHHDRLRDWQHIWSVMLYPSDSTARDAYFAAERNRIARDLAQRMSLEELRERTMSQPEAAADILSYLVRPPDPPKSKTAERHGLVAGCVLNLALNMAQEGHDASLRKVIFVLDKIWRGRRDRSGSPLRTSSSKMHAAWMAFQPVAHLWGAYLLAADDMGMSDVELSRRLQHFLSMAESLQRMGEQYIPHRSRVPLINTSKTWTVPQHYPLLQIYPSFPPLPATTLTLLAQYEALD